MSLFESLVVLCSVLSSAIAAVTGFGIGSILTPLFNLEVELKLAVALVSIPHLVATAERFWHLRRDVDRKVLLSFGLASAVGGLLGAFLNARFHSASLTVLFGCLLIFAGVMGVTGYAQRLRFGRVGSFVAGVLSGTFGGLVGNQGGIRAAAMLTFGLAPEVFVATSTAIGLVVDFARMPIYFATESSHIFEHAKIVGFAVLGVTVGSFLGMRFLRRFPKHLFHKFVSAVVLVLGIVMLYRGLRGAA